MSDAPTMPHDRGRWMAIDWGERRIGLAISDPTGIIATPSGVIVRRVGKRPPIAELVRRAIALEARAIVMGLPLDGEGDETPRSLECRRVADELARRTSLPVALMDERFSTASALRGVRESGGSVQGRKADIDALAAATILQQAMRMQTLALVQPAAEPNAEPTAEPADPTISSVHIDVPR